jgi:hypothetical protein
MRPGTPAADVGISGFAATETPTELKTVNFDVGLRLGVWQG